MKTRYDGDPQRLFFFLKTGVMDAQSTTKLHKRTTDSPFQGTVMRIMQADTVPTGALSDINYPDPPIRGVERSKQLAMHLHLEQ